MDKKYVIDNLELMKEWHFEKNNKLKCIPQTLTTGSNKKVWWLCGKGHEWQATIYHRNSGLGCPYCSGRYAIKGETDLKTVNPSLAKEWNHDKNNRLTPMEVTSNSHKKVWWKCSKGHEWQSTITNRNHGRGCPYCSNKKILQGYNDLQTINPILANEWDYEKNVGVTPTQVGVGSEKKVWWKCEKGHEWIATIVNRSKGSNCPYCSGRYAIEGETDLQTINPMLLKEWNYEKNNERGFFPRNFTCGSEKKVWWKCEKGHEWESRISPRNNGVGCPICSSELYTSFPECALVFYLKKCGIEVIHSYKEQGYELDIYIPSKQIAIEYDGYFWHKNKEKKDLEKNHKCKKNGIKLYRIREGLSSLNDTSIDYVIQKNQKDLAQILEKVLVEIMGININVDLTRDAIAIEKLREFTKKEKSFLFANPKIASEWNYDKNGNLKPENFTANSGRKVWWKCRKGHEWQTIIKTRNKGHGCPYCAGQRAIKGETDLLTVNPILASEWDYEKNNGITPMDVMPNSNKKVWWKCHGGHEWQARIADRNKGRACPQCAKEK